MSRRETGYIAGVTNPRFEELPFVWDVLCNVKTGRITVSKEIDKLPPDSKSDASSVATRWTSTTTPRTTPSLKQTETFSSSTFNPLPPLPTASTPSSINSDELASLSSPIERDSDASSLHTSENGGAGGAKGRQSRSDSASAGTGRGELSRSPYESDISFMAEVRSLPFSSSFISSDSDPVCPCSWYRSTASSTTVRPKRPSDRASPPTSSASSAWPPDMSTRPRGALRSGTHQQRATPREAFSARARSSSTAKSTLVNVRAARGGCEIWWVRTE